MVKEHQDDGRGFWTCLAVGKNNVTVKTTRERFMACGHCLKFITDAQGNKMPYSVLDCLTNSTVNPRPAAE